MWGRVADSLGIASHVVVPTAALVLIVPAVMLAAGASATLPGRMAARLRPAAALRAE